jgi:nucleotide-binding universal stress UspA family protein
MKKILCPVDLSETSRHALREAIRVTRLEGGTLTVLRVHQPHAVGSFEDLSDDMQPVLEKGDLKAFEEWLEEERRAADGQEIAGQFLVGEPASTIVDVAKEGGYELVVIGNKGRSAINRFLLGSVTSKVMHHAPCNVLLVR